MRLLTYPRTFVRIAGSDLPEAILEVGATGLWERRSLCW